MSGSLRKHRGSSSCGLVVDQITIATNDKFHQFLTTIVVVVVAPSKCGAQHQHDTKLKLPLEVALL